MASPAPPRHCSSQASRPQKGSFAGGMYGGCRRLARSSRPRHVRPQPLSDPTAGRVGRARRAPAASAKRHAAASLSSRRPLRPAPDEVTDLVQRHEVAHLAANGRNADLEPSLARAVAMANADDDGPATTADPTDAVRRAEVVDVMVERQRPHRASVLRRGGCRERAAPIVRPRPSRRIVRDAAAPQRQGRSAPRRPSLRRTARRRSSGRSRRSPTSSTSPRARR